MSKNQNHSFYSGQSQQTQTIQWTNQNSKQIYVAGAKRGKKRVQASHDCMVLVLLLVGWESDAMQCKLKAIAKLLSTLNWKLLYREFLWLFSNPTHVNYGGYKRFFLILLQILGSKKVQLSLLYIYRNCAVQIMKWLIHWMLDYEKLHKHSSENWRLQVLTFTFIVY